MDENLISKRNELKRKLVPLEWDKRLNQLHYAREVELKAYRLELEAVEKQIAEGANV